MTFAEEIQLKVKEESCVVRSHSDIDKGTDVKPAVRFRQITNCLFSINVNKRRVYLG